MFCLISQGTQQKWEKLNLLQKAQKWLYDYLLAAWKTVLVKTCGQTGEQSIQITP
ncbi:uncharacterized protein ANIA_11486 [Aspergillus nidulans FGSC A4]|uniref:Uncharacterized protein n=1 Tax=Emericella nidulans (strain FGSC A4 / ATCC 38163 / CBS 112.46 / NRRL 194 / M139) TaxID=227321 RepID=C8VFZ4_EMENI|nr:hypothetical protein [Aspergillus nidulans FGSC A4]CBF81566.1 TPA: hypothetical protein ANIA_11486 [Aspergillus nidulans FGSC A4]